MRLTLTLTAAIALGACAATASAAPVLVFQTDFDSGLPAEFAPGTATLTEVQGYGGLGPAGNQFGGLFLRSETSNVVTLTLTGLPEHDTITLAFLFAAIDSLDGSGTFPEGDFFRIVFDGNELFSESFANALPSQIQSYASPPGVELARHQNLGFTQGAINTDSAYNMGADPRFSEFAHSGSTATIQFYMFGDGIQPLNDESWAIDNLRVSVDTTHTVPEPGLLGLASVAVGAAILRRRSRL